MKKQIAFYIGWDVIFIVFLRFYDYKEIWELNYIRKNYTNAYTINFLSGILMELGLLFMIGVIICLLVYISFQFKFTRKLAILEFVIIGITSFQLATLMVISYLGHINVLEHFPENLPPWSYWLYYSSSTQTYVTIGSILFGYELIIFIIRMIKCKQIKNPTESE